MGVITMVDLQEDVEGEAKSYYECSNATAGSSNVGHIKARVPCGARVTSLYENTIIFVNVGLGLATCKIVIPRIGWPGTCLIVWIIGILALGNFSSIFFSQVYPFICITHVFVLGIFSNISCACP